MANPNSPQSRRTFLQRGSLTVAGTALAGGLPALAVGAESALAADAPANVIVAENTQNPSTFTTDFQVSNISTVVSGYARRTSVNLGEPIDLAITGPNLYLSDPADGPWAEGVQVEMYRLGYYGGKGGRLVWKAPGAVSTWQRFDSKGNPAADGTVPPFSPVDTSTGLEGRAGWHTTLTIPGDAATVSGVYLIKLKGNWFEFPPGVPAVQQTGESHAIVIVRDDNRPRDLLAVLPSNTWQAYNYSTGRSLYTYQSRFSNSGSIVPATGAERAAKVSLDRPFGNFIADYNWVL
ncbi:MAG: N,N-dimethylformamidase beta subunit family domain-containing protein, partial [Solirubrobacteraceae bacterium]|nr:hypothetical protein [Patulibacter sp.]